MLRSKRGLSPLIAAVLLIVVVVGIGAVVTGIVRSQVTSDKQTIEKTSVDIDCSTQVEIDVPMLNDDFMICQGSGYVNFTLENSGSLLVDEIQVKVFGDAGFAENDSLLTTGLEPGAVESRFIAGFNTADVGNVEEVFIIPKKKVIGGTGRIYCSEAQLRFTNIVTC